MSGLRQSIQQGLAQELNERGEAPIAGGLGVETVMAVADSKAQLQRCM
jgi:hypothetical protein